MNYAKIIKISLIFLPLTGCGRTVDINQTVERNDTLYEINSTVPYTGKVEAFYDNGQKKSVESYINGLCDGEQNSWYENGQKKQEGTCGNGKDAGVVARWHENGQPKLIEPRNGVTQYMGVWPGMPVEMLRDQLSELLECPKDKAAIDEVSEWVNSSRIGGIHCYEDASEVSFFSPIHTLPLLEIISNGDSPDRMVVDGVERVDALRISNVTSMINPTPLSRTQIAFETLSNEISSWDKSQAEGGGGTWNFKLPRHTVDFAEHEGRSEKVTYVNLNFLHEESVNTKTHRALAVLAEYKTSVMEFRSMYAKFPPSVYIPYPDTSIVTGASIDKNGVLKVYLTGAKEIEGNSLELTPTLILGDNRVSWSCSSSDIEPKYLPVECRN